MLMRSLCIIIATFALLLSCNNSSDYSSTLYSAVLSGDQNLVLSCIEKGADMNYSPDKHSPSVLGLAAEKGDLKTCEILIQNGADVNYEYLTKSINGKIDEVQENALGRSVCNGNYDTTEYLIDSGADVNSECFALLNPGHIALFRRDIDIIELLLERGMDVNKLDNNVNSMPVFRILVDPHSCQYCYAYESRAQYVNNVDIRLRLINIMVENGANVNVEYGFNNWTPIFDAINYLRDPVYSSVSTQDQITVLEALIKNGANVNHIVTPRTTALHFAAQLGNYKLCKMLVDSGAKLDIVDSTGKTPYDVFIESMNNQHNYDFPGLTKVEIKRMKNLLSAK